MTEALIERILKEMIKSSVSLSDYIYPVEYGFHFFQYIVVFAKLQNISSIYR